MLTLQLMSVQVLNYKIYNMLNYKVYHTILEIKSKDSLNLLRVATNFRFEPRLVILTRHLLGISADALKGSGYI